ncbi:hypothetical protein AB0G04_13155 [Actinoplanes sp. NPDC023801]|uniref:hypothetical protein n=1 Tax=Actinoplanes sp. NPDC023801 TaxID=3154595 RepID=UPI0033C8CE94
MPPVLFAAVLIAAVLIASVLFAVGPGCRRHRSAAVPASLELGDQAAETLLVFRLGELAAALLGELPAARAVEEGLDALRNGSHALNVPSRGAAESWRSVTFRGMLGGNCL